MRRTYISACTQIFTRLIKEKTFHFYKAKALFLRNAGRVCISLPKLFGPVHLLITPAVGRSEIVRGCEMLKAHTATFPCGSFSRKSEAAVVLWNQHQSINQSSQLPHTSFSLPSFSSPGILFCQPPCILASFRLPALFAVELCPSGALCFALHSSLSSRLSLQPPGHFRQAVCHRFINRLFSVR